MYFFGKYKAVAGVLSIVLLIISGFAYAAPGPLPMPQSQKLIQPGDALRIYVWQAAQRNIKQDLIDLVADDYIINGDGYVLFPIIGRLKVKGLSVGRLEETLVEKYRPYIKNPIIIITPLIRVVLQGAFNKPGSYRIDPKSSLWELVEIAGGPGQGCDLKKLRVERSGAIVVENLLKSFERGHSIEDVNIRSGDQIIAPYKGGIRVEQVLRYLSFAMTAVLFYLQLEGK